MREICRRCKRLFFYPEDDPPIPMDRLCPTCSGLKGKADPDKPKRTTRTPAKRRR